ncbi:flavin-nucleotide-binding protein [Sorangium sp. So ce363]|uniref:flavin-nucleotide-binding protein n=1 Tax=Sorangium sp. So ce363 TaxID=3133304 RepID=UPI003F5FD295
MTSLPGWTREGSPYHPGEMAVQARAGARERAEKAGRRIIRDFMPDQHRELFAQLPFLLVGALDAERRPWASIVVGPPGFISSPDPRTLAVNARPGAGDALGPHLVAGAPVGLLGIQLETRRRNRMNGTITAADERGFVVEVGQSFGNCAQYIQAREPELVRAPEAAAAPPAHAERPALSAGAAALIRRADTFFIATAAPAARGGDAIEGADVSHRGGKPGFVRVTEEDGHTVLTSPDFTGNFAFNTLGNLALCPSAGVLFVDFASGGVLSLTGEAEVLWDGPELSAFTGAQRLLRFHVAEGAFREDALPLRWSAPVPAPQLAATGSWEDVARG